MNKIEASSHLNVRNTWRVDSHVTDELGYGRYSTQIGIVQYESIHSHALISICEDKILIVLTAHPDHPLQHRIDHREKSYCILFADITDVVAKAASSVDAEDSSVKKKMPRLKVLGKHRHSLHIYLKQHRVCCVVDTFDGDFIVKMIVSSWQSDLIRRSAAIQPLTGCSSTISMRKSTAEYHAETVRCLKAVTRHEELMELLHDLSCELTNDLELKDLIFRSKEVMVQCLHIVQDLLSFKAVFPLKEGDCMQQQSPDEEILPINSNKTKIAAAAGSSARQRSRVDPSSSSSSSIERPTKRFGKRGPVTRGDVLSYEEERKLKVVAARRLLIVEGIYQLFSALLFSSECLSSRFSVIIGSSPMDLQSWMDLLLPDIYDLICGALGCLDLTKEEEIKQDLALSLEQQGLKLSHRSRDSSEYDAQYALAVGTPRRPLATPRMAESVLVPVSARVRAMAAAAPSVEYLRAMRTLATTRNSIRDLQGVLLSQLQGVFSLSKALSRVGAQWQQQQHLTSLVGPAISSGLMQLQQYESIGDMFVRTEGWEDSLEELLIRLCSVLEDVLSTTRVKAEDITTISRNTQAIKHGGSWSSSNPIVSRLRTSSDYSGPLDAVTAPASAVPPSPRTKTGPRKLLPSGPPLSESTPRFNPNTTPRFLTPTTPRQQNPSTPRQQNPLSLSIPLSLSSSVITPRDHLLHSSASTSSLLMLMDINSTSSNSAAVTTTSGKLLPILPAFPKKPNLHALLGSSGALNLQGIAEMSENEYFDSSAAGASDESSSPMATSPLRTQEILLFYFVSLLLHLAKDSHRIRDALRTDLAVHLQTMISIFNVICPRPITRGYATAAGTVSADKRDPKTTEKSMPKRDARDEPDRSIADTQHAAAAADPLQSASLSASGGYVKRFIRMFSAPCSTSVIGTSDHREGGSKRPGKGLSHDRGSSAIDGMSTHQGAANSSIPALLLFDYGAPPYELSEPSWMLMVSARRSLEDLLVSLGVRSELITSRPNPLVREAMLTALAPVGKIDGIEEGGSDEEYDSPRVDAYNETASDYDNSALNTARSINDLSKLAITSSELEVPSRWNTLTTPRLSFTPRRRDPAPHSHWGRTDKDH